MRQTIYRWRPGARMSGSAQSAGEIIDRLQRSQGRAAPEDIVEAAKPKSSPIHGHFEWDDTEAARKFRIEQAGTLVRSIELVRVDSVEAPAKARAFASIVQRGEAGRTYMHVKDALEDPDYRAQVLAEAQQEMSSFRIRFSSLTELAKVFAAIDAVVRRLEPLAKGKR